MTNENKAVLPLQNEKVSMQYRHHKLAEAAVQREILEHGRNGSDTMVPFQQKLSESGLYPLHPTGIQIFQLNVGKVCNQVCRHCHVDAGPDRREVMSRDTMRQCLAVLQQHPEFSVVDITGGAPEMNPHFRWFVEEVSKLNRKVMVRCNLTIILANKSYHDLPQFYKEHGVEVVSSLPFYTQDRTDRQRGEGVFEDSIKALQWLNDVGYGYENSGLVLNLVFNPAGAFLSPPQAQLEREYRKALLDNYGIRFNALFAITNLPISRYLDYLLQSGNYEKYMDKLVKAFNPVAAAGVMCRNTISVGWDGFLYDCDFNQMLDLKVSTAAKHISSFDAMALNSREIVVCQHCYGCTAGAGSSCGGAVT